MGVLVPPPVVVFVVALSFLTWELSRFLCQQRVVAVSGYFTDAQAQQVTRREHRFGGPALLIRVPPRAVVSSGMRQRDRGGGGHGPRRRRTASGSTLCPPSSERWQMGCRSPAELPCGCCLRHAVQHCVAAGRRGDYTVSSLLRILISVSGGKESHIFSCRRRNLVFFITRHISGASLSVCKERVVQYPF